MLNMFNTKNKMQHKNNIGLKGNQQLPAFLSENSGVSDSMSTPAWDRIHSASSSHSMVMSQSCANLETPRATQLLSLVSKQGFF